MPLACITSKWLQIGTDMLLIIKSTRDELLNCDNIDDLKLPKQEILVNFCNVGLALTFQE